jgi:phytoene dehydrogenase-like protein
VACSHAAAAAALWPLLRDLQSSLAEVLQRSFGDDEAIKLALAANLPYYADDPDRLWWLGHAVAQGFYLSGGGYYIKGGSRVLSERLVAIIREEGGEAVAGRQVDEILLGDRGEVVGVRHQCCCRIGGGVWMTSGTMPPCSANRSMACDKHL